MDVMYALLDKSRNNPTQIPRNPNSQISLFQLPQRAPRSANPRVDQPKAAFFFWSIIVFDQIFIRPFQHSRGIQPDTQLQNHHACPAWPAAKTQRTSSPALRTAWG